MKEELIHFKEEKLNSDMHKCLAIAIWTCSQLHNHSNELQQQTMSASHHELSILLTRSATLKPGLHPAQNRERTSVF